MRAIRAIRDRIKRVELLLDIASAVLAVYLAAGTIFRGGHFPSAHFWATGTVWFILLVFAAVWVPLFALYKALDSRLETEDRIAAERARRSTALDRDLLLFCQRAVAEIAEACPQVPLNRLAAHVWTCCDDGTFERRARFYLPHHHKTSGVDWRNGKGAAGWAWATNRNISVDLRPLHARRRKIGETAFDALEPEERFGMTYREFEDSDSYTGIIAVRLFATEPVPKLRGIFLLDYTGGDHFDCVQQAMRGARLSAILGGCEKLLTEEVQGGGD